MREYYPFGHYQGTTLYYNDTIITVGDPDYARLEYKCHLQNHNKSICIGHWEIENILNLQRVIKEATK